MMLLTWTLFRYCMFALALLLSLVDAAPFLESDLLGKRQSGSKMVFCHFMV